MVGGVMMRQAVMAAVILMGAAGVARADPLLGDWKTARQDDGTSGIVRVAPCGAALCGSLIRSFDASGKEVANPGNGMLILSETVARGGGDYRGKVYAPDRDMTYASRLELRGDSLRVSGCVMGICRDGGLWQRAD
jgi:uncharacterized protein (DUF2147 family)